MKNRPYHIYLYGILILFISSPSLQANEKYPWVVVEYSGAIRDENVTVVSDVFFSNKEFHCSSFMKYVHAEVNAFVYRDGPSPCTESSTRTEDEAIDSRSEMINISKRYNHRIIRLCYKGCRRHHQR